MNDYLLKKGKLLYIVKNEDTILSLCERFNLTPRIIIKENCLKNEIVKGMVIFLPIVKGELHTVTVEECKTNFSEKTLRFNKIDRIYPFCRLLLCT